MICGNKAMAEGLQSQCYCHAIKWQYSMVTAGLPIGARQVGRSQSEKELGPIESYAGHDWFRVPAATAADVAKWRRVAQREALPAMAKTWECGCGRERRAHKKLVHFNFGGTRSNFQMAARPRMSTSKRRLSGSSHVGGGSPVL